MAEKSTGERLQKVLSRAGVASRRGAEDLIRAGRVTVDGRLAVLGERVAAGGTSTVFVDGEPITWRKKCLYILLHKPTGYVTTRSDPEGRRTVMELVPAGWRARLKPVGRLDYHTEGLLLLTDDGDLANRLTHPRYGSSKRYLVKVRGVPDVRAIARLERGMVIAGRRTAPLKPRRVTRKGARAARSSSWWEVALREGRTRQIREMFFRIGHPVQRLRRVAIGGLEDAGLGPGSWRELSASEAAALGARRAPVHQRFKRSSAGAAEPRRQRRR